MDEEVRQSATRAEAEIAALVRSVRRQTIAVWVLVGLLILVFASPWLSFLFHRSTGADLVTSASSAGDGARFERAEPFDNDFYARPIEEKISRASAILVTRIEKDGERSREVVAEILKQKAGVRLFYRVGDEFEKLSRAKEPACDGCEEMSRVVFMLGNPASMAFSTTFHGERLMSQGGMPIAELRRLAQASLAPPSPAN